MLVRVTIEAVEDAYLPPPHLPGSRYGSLLSTSSQLAVTGAARATGKERRRIAAAIVLAILLAALWAIMMAEEKGKSQQNDQQSPTIGLSREEMVAQYLYELWEDAA